ncbi:MAG TPA: Glu-tRNA(Gln) amidotransferase subunit GatE [Terriglobales bacterium]|nr:Glu-tRNA(Gln) amidotransferase subunit GatE [Terriglobales bacterium]
MLQTLDYQSVGLISGLEVHQQLLTREKLFCRCPAGLFTETHDGEVLRHMRPTLSELGEYDGTALMEFKTKKEIVYLLNQLNVCTYDMDDTPPFLVNQEAIDIAIELCLAMHMDIIDEVHIARKQYLDGSIPTGFQRTAIIGVNGWLPFKGRKLTVTHVSLEEDSCREVIDKGHRIVFRTDRLGTPLTETVTGAELRTPEEVRDAILLCSLTARSTGRVRTGLGAGRQDINVSVRGGCRVEIKGVPRAPYAVKLVHNEGIRQSNLLKLRDELHARGLRRPTDIQMRISDVSDIFADAPVEFVQRARANGSRVMAVRINGVKGLAEFPTQPSTMFTDELSGRIRVIACLDEPPIVMASAQIATLPAGRRIAEKISRRVQAGAQDDFFVVWGPEEDCRTAAEEIRIRFADATEGVPKETRQSLPGGFTTFERILPGPDRMYPDTDSPPTRITDDRVEQARQRLHTAPWERLERYSSWRVPVETTEYLIRRGGAEIVDAAVKETGVDGLTAAVEIGQVAKSLKRSGVPIERLGTEQWVDIFDLHTDGRLPRECIREVATFVGLEPGTTAKAACASLGIDLQNESEWKPQVSELLAHGYTTDTNDSPEKRMRFVVGKAVEQLKRKVPAREIAAFVKAELQGASK